MVQVKVTISPVVLPPSHTITISKLRGLNCRRVIPESSNRGVNTVAQIRRYLCFVIRLNHLSCPRLWSASAMLPAVAGSQERYPTMKYHQLGWVWALFFSTHRAQFFARKEGRSCRWADRNSTRCMLSPAWHHAKRAMISRTKPVHLPSAESELGASHCCAPILCSVTQDACGRQEPWCWLTGAAKSFGKPFWEGEALPFTECSTGTVPCADNQPFIAVITLQKSCCVLWWRLCWLEAAHLSALWEFLQRILTVVFACWSITHKRAGSFSLRWGSGAINTADHPWGPLHGDAAVSSPVWTPDDIHPGRAEFCANLQPWVLRMLLRLPWDSQLTLSPRERIGYSLIPTVANRAESGPPYWGNTWDNKPWLFGRQKRHLFVPQELGTAGQWQDRRVHWR